MGEGDLDQKYSLMGGYGLFLRQVSYTFWLTYFLAGHSKDVEVLELPVIDW